MNNAARQTKGKPGRKLGPGGYMVNTALRMRVSLLEQVQAAAEAQDVTVSEWMRDAIKAKLEGKSK